VIILLIRRINIKPLNFYKTNLLVFSWIFIIITPKIKAEITSADAFKQTVWIVTRANCAGCHATGQSPYHANSDYVVAHNAVVNNSLANLTTPSSSALYTKVKGGHHCWSASCANDANTMLTQITSWKTLLAANTGTTSTSTTSTTTTSSSTSTSSSSSNSSTTSSTTAASLAYRLYSRIAGVPPTSGVQSEVQTLISNGKIKDAAYRAMDDAGFYNLTLKNWVKPWTNIDKTNRVAFNDYVATVIGIIRDNIPFDQVIYGDHLYVAATTTPVTIAAYSTSNNTHYQNLEDKGVNLKDYLVRVSQTKYNGIKDSAGVLTSRAAGAAFYSAGTNRRQTRFTFINFACKDFEDLHDINITDYHVRRDVDRKPGGDSRTYKNKCVGCHAGQDALGGAFAYYDFVNNALTYTPGAVVSKINKNNAYDDGWVTKDDSWVNTWAEGQNSSLGWPSKVSGNGVRELGIMISRSRVFAECMSTKVYELVCMRSPTTANDVKAMKSLADKFQENANFNMKNLIAETAVSCFGE
jgi:mono/diheme cytochrome c family protein